MTSVKAGVQIPADELHIMIDLGLVMEQARDALLAAGVDDLRPSQFRVIAMVPPRGSVTVTELADRVGMTKQAIGQFVARLVETGHLVTEADPEDGRLRRVRRTAEGTRATRHLAARLRALEDEWAARVGVRRYRQFRAVLEELAEPE